ncbi:MAG TPA: CUAEP/CCAEP-tail radical SAM protein [Acidimicrobiales bacterium]|nr:CUAEP/CCAEP-tail radical SAM protein [Acidimicrobiales bacterium]
MHVALISTYELGHQPLHVASPAGALERAGHDVHCMDLSVDPLDPDILAWADAVACSVPMHTAMRLALAVCDEVRGRYPDIPLCLYGLYAGLDAGRVESSTSSLVDRTIAGEYEPALVAWVDELAAEGGRRQGPRADAVASIGRGRFGLPARRLLPPLDRYARLSVAGELRLAGYVEASHGCAHRCRHCPVPVVYDGRTRLVGEEAVVADVAQLVDLGARHVTFGDPDFLNGPHHAVRVVAAVHGAFPKLTFDVTAKVEHVLRHRDMWPALARAGLLFVVSAFESASDHVLAMLDKGHTVADEIEAVAVLRASGVEPRPSLMPFTPWTTATDVRDLLDMVSSCDLVGNVDPVHFAIRLLVPPGSLLLASGALDGALGPYDPEGLSWTWRSPDPRLDVVQREVAAVAVRAAADEWPGGRAYGAVRAAVDAGLAGDIGHLDAPPPVSDGRLRSALAPDDRPRLTEAWFCCAEPTDAQFRALHVETTSPAGGS